MERLHAGESVAAYQILLQHPHLAAELAEPLEAAEMLHHAARAHRSAADTSSSKQTLISPGTEAQPACFGRYRILEVLGKGASAVVHRAYDSKLEREVALKLFRRDQAGRADLIGRFIERDVRIAAQLRHPHIVPFHEAGEHQGQHYIDMELIRGETLEAQLQQAQGRPMDPRAAATLVQKVAEALHYAHQEGIVHRDVKPSNILIDPKNEPQLTDFGLARRVDGDQTLTLQGQVLGTPHYMSPEQADGRAYEADARSDVFSLGVVLYRLLTGRLPFFYAGSIPLLDQIRYHGPPRLRGVSPTVPRDLEIICLKALEKAPAARFISAGAFAAELGRWLNDEPLQVRPPTLGEKARRLARRNPVASGLAAAVAVSLVAGTAVSLYFAVEATERAKQVLQEQVTGARRQYVADLRLARTAWDESHIEQFNSLLDGQLPQNTYGKDLRGWEWHYWNRLRYAGVTTLGDHKGRVSGVAYSPDGRWLASCSYDGTVCLREAGSGRLVHTLLADHPAIVSSVAFNRDGSRLASASADGRVRLWDTESGRLVRKFLCHEGGANSVAFSPDGSRLVSAYTDDKTVRVWDTSRGDPVAALKGHTKGVYSAVFSPDGRKVVSVSRDQIVRLWEVETETQLRSFPTGAESSAVAISPDGRYLAWSTGRRDEPEGLIVTWDLVNDKELPPCKGHARGVLWIAFCPKGKRLASGGGDRTVKLWDVATQQEEFTLRGHASAVLGGAFSRDGSRLASAGEDHTVKIWDLAQEQEPQPLKDT